MMAQTRIARVLVLVAFVSHSCLPLGAADMGRNLFERQALAEPPESIATTPKQEPAVRTDQLAAAMAATNGRLTHRGRSESIEQLENRSRPPRDIRELFRRLLEPDMPTLLIKRSEASPVDFVHIVRGAAIGLLHRDHAVRMVAQEMLIILANSEIDLARYARKADYTPATSILWKVLAWSVLPWQKDGVFERALLSSYFGDEVIPLDKATRQSESKAFIYRFVEGDPHMLLPALSLTIAQLRSKIRVPEALRILAEVKREAEKLYNGNVSDLYQEVRRAKANIIRAAKAPIAPLDIDGNVLQPGDSQMTRSDGGRRDPPPEILSLFQDLSKKGVMAQLETMSQTSSDNFGHVVRGATVGVFHPDASVRRVVHKLLIYLANSAIVLEVLPPETSASPAISVIWKVLGWLIIPWEKNGQTPLALFHIFYGEKETLLDIESRQSLGKTILYEVANRRPEERLPLVIATIVNLQQRLATAGFFDALGILETLKGEAERALYGTELAQQNNSLIMTHRLFKTGYGPLLSKEVDHYFAQPEDERFIPEPAPPRLPSNYQKLYLYGDERIAPLLRQQYDIYRHAEGLATKQGRKKLAGAA